MRLNDAIRIHINDQTVSAKLWGVHTERASLEQAAALLDRMASAMAEATADLRGPQPGSG